MIDGRTVTGIFTCLDRLNNLYLTNVTERRTTRLSTYDITNSLSDEQKCKNVELLRYLDSVVLKGTLLTKVEIKRDECQKYQREFNEIKKRPQNITEEVVENIID